MDMRPESRIALLEAENARLKIERDRLRILGQLSTYASLLDSMPGEVFFEDLEHRLLLVNRAFASRFGKQPADMVGESALELYGPLKQFYLDKRAEAFLAFAAGKPCLVFAYDRQLADGRVQARETALYPRYDVDGVLEGVLVIGVDATEVTRLAQQLEVQRRLLERVVDQMPVGICYLDVQMSYRWANRAYCELLELDPRHVIGRHVLDFFPHFEWPNPRIAEVLATKRVQEFRAFPFRLGEHVRLFDFSYVPVLEQDQVVGILHILREVSPPDV